LLPRLPFAQWTDDGLDKLVQQFSPLFDGITVFLESIVEGTVNVLNLVPSIVLAFIFAILAWGIASRRIAIFTLIGFLFIDYLGFWFPMLQMLVLVLTSVLLAVVLGIPIGIWASQKSIVRKIINPILDFMQTMPAFVYLIPA